MPYPLPKELKFADWGNHKEFLQKHLKVGQELKNVEAAAKSCDPKSPDYLAALHDALQAFLEFAETALAWAKKTKDFPADTVEWLKTVIKAAKPVIQKLVKLLGGKEEPTEEEPIYQNQEKPATPWKPATPSKPAARTSEEPVYQNQEKPATPWKPAIPSKSGARATEEPVYQNQEKPGARATEEPVVLKPGASPAAVSSDIKLGAIPDCNPDGAPWPSYLVLAKKAKLDLSKLPGAEAFLPKFQDYRKKGLEVRDLMEKFLKKTGQDDPLTRSDLEKAKNGIAEVRSLSTVVKVARVYDQVTSEWFNQYPRDSDVGRLTDRMSTQANLFTADYEPSGGYDQCLKELVRRILTNEKNEKKDGSPGSEDLWRKLASVKNASDAKTILKALNIPENEIAPLKVGGSDTAVRALLEKYNAPEDVIKKVIESGVLLP
jgi:hypothetical protein